MCVGGLSFYCMWDPSRRWEVVWHLSVWHYQWCVRECQKLVGERRRGVATVDVGVCVCVDVCAWATGGRVGGRDFHRVTKQMVQIWVGVRLSKARFIQQPCASPRFHLHRGLSWGFHCLLAHCQPRAKLQTFVCTQHKWHTARPHIVAKFRSEKKQSFNSVRYQTDASSSRIAHHTVEERG